MYLMAASLHTVSIIRDLKIYNITQINKWVNKWIGEK